MSERQAKAVAAALRADAWDSGGGIWLVVIRRADGKVVLISDEVVKVYSDYQTFDDDRCDAELILH